MAAALVALSALETEVLEAARRAPSPHNAQPWRLRRLDEGRYQLLYAHSDKLLCDPDDRDAYLALGTLLESAALRASELGHCLVWDAVDRPALEGVLVGEMALRDRDVEADHLARHLPSRHTNRQPYQRTGLPDSLRSALEALGCLFFDPDQMADLVERASVLAWKDRNFTRDLRDWTRFSHDAEDGMTCRSLRLNVIDQQFLKLALRLGSLPAPLARLYAVRDVYLTRMSGGIVVITSPSMQPADLLDAGRRLLRAWLTVSAAGWASHPISIVIDQETKTELAERIGHPLPVAIFRIGIARGPAEDSGRRPLERVLVP